MFSVKKRRHVNSPTLHTHRLIVKLLFLFLLTTLALSACHEKEEHLSLSLDSISQISDESMLVSEESLREAIHHMVMADSDRDVAAMQTRRHYLNGGAIRWMTRDGVSAKADSLVAYLERVEQVGISPKLFYASQIKDDLERVRSLNFGEGKNSVSRVYGRLEYLLTRLSSATRKVSASASSIHVKCLTDWTFATATLSAQHTVSFTMCPQSAPARITWRSHSASWAATTHRWLNSSVSQSPRIRYTPPSYATFQTLSQRQTCNAFSPTSNEADGTTATIRRTTASTCS